jgi:GH25 family lysozyme M1 (1,4-beta-N-acetylmuramidase)
VKQKGNILALAIIVLTVALTAALILISSAPAANPEPTETIPPNRYNPEDFAYEGDYLTCLAGETVMGIDVSRYQGVIDWRQVKAAGVEFVMIRLGYRGTPEGTLNQDPMFWRNLLGARAAGLKVGAYFYSQALTVAEAKEEAAKALEILDGFLLDMPLVFDWEQESRTENMDKRTLTDCTLAFCDAVAQAGYEPMVYFNRYQAQELLLLEELQHLPWWLAMYDVTAEFPYKVDMWQYTCTGTIPGIEGSVDINLLFPQE